MSAHANPDPPTSPEPILLATRSPDKAREIRLILEGVLTRELVTLDDVDLAPHPDEDQVEVHATFLANAAAKAAFFRNRTGLAVLADDSGLAVDALDGAPGVLSRRFSGADLAGRALDLANNALLLRKLDGLPAASRRAHYVCAAAFLAVGAPVMAIGSVSGSIAAAPAGELGFGYDPLFVLPELGTTFAQIRLETKNRYSHRARAFRALAALCYDDFRG